MKGGRGREREDREGEGGEGGRGREREEREGGRREEEGGREEGREEKEINCMIAIIHYESPIRQGAVI